MLNKSGMMYSWKKGKMNLFSALIELVIWCKIRRWLRNTMHQGENENLYFLENVCLKKKKLKVDAATKSDDNFF